MKNIDLHLHSNWSLDGDYPITELIEHCHQADLKYIALSDHNSIGGVREMIIEGRKHGITVIPAIEIDCEYHGVNLHILGYNIDINDFRFNKLGYDLMMQEQDSSAKRIELIESLDIYVNRDKIGQLQIDGIITGEMIAEASLYEPENLGHPLLKPFLEGGQLADNPFVNFYWEYCAQGKPAYIPIEIPSLDEIIELIQQSGGIAVLAHPGHNINDDPVLLGEIMKCGLDGIEAYSSYHSVEQIAFYTKYANDNNKLVTCGSDFHGKIKPNIRLGEIDFPEVEFAKLSKKLHL